MKIFNFYRMIFVSFILSSVFMGLAYSAAKIPAINVIATDKNNVQRNLQDILNQILPTDRSVDMSGLTASVSELNILDGFLGTTANLNELRGGGSTALHAHAASVLTFTLDDAYDDGQAITIDSAHLDFNLNDATNDYRVEIDNTTTGAIADALFFNTSGSGGTFTDAIDCTDSGITNCMNLGTTTITGTTAVIDFTDFDVSADGVITLAPDTDADTITISPSAAFTTDAIDLSSTNIGNALNVGANAITGDAYTFTSSSNNDITFDMGGTGDLVVTGTDWSVTAAGVATINGGINLSGGTAAGANTLDWGNGAADDLTATDVTDLTDGGTSALHSHAASVLTFTLDDAYDDGQSITVDTGAGLTLTMGASQDLVINADTTNQTATAGVIDLDMGTTTTSASAVDVKVIQDSGMSANAEAFAQKITLQGDDADGELVGIDITGSATTNATTDTYTAGIRIDNAENTADSMTDAILITSSGVNNGVTDAIDASAANITNAINVGANIIATNAATIGSNDASVIDFTDFDVDADGAITLAPDTANAAYITISPSVSQTTGRAAVDLSSASIDEAIDIGANKIEGTNFKFDGVGQITLGTGGGGGGSTGTGILTFKGGGTIDSTSDGDIVIAPQDAGIVDFPAGTTVRLPQASPIEDKNGLYWDQVNSKLCIDKSTDICTSALTLASVSLNTEQTALLADFIQNKEGVIKLNKILSNVSNVDKLEKLTQISLGSSLLQPQGRASSSRISQDQPLETSSRPYVLQRDSAQLTKGEVFIEFDSQFLKMMEVDSLDPNYKVQVTPTSFDVIGPLVVKKFENGFKVIDVGGETNVTFDWEVAALKKIK